MIKFKRETLKPQMETYIDKNGRLVERFNESLEVNVEINTNTLAMLEAFENYF